MRRFLMIGVCAAMAMFVATHARAAAGPAKPPNIVILLADDLGYGDLGFQGGKDIPTPHVDSLAANGVRFTNGYVSGPYCSPTRAGLITGRYQTRFGHEFNPAGERGLPKRETTIADRLKAAGYATGLVGKWHLGATPELRPQKRGFDEFFGFHGGAHVYFAEQSQTIFRGDSPVVEKEYLTDAFAREAVSFIDRHQSHPFFLYLAFNAVHTPMHATDARLKRFASIQDEQRRTYAAMLSALDEAVGRVLDKLRASGLEENTLIFFFSDNGGPTMPTTTINGSSNAPLRGSKRTTLEGGVHVPFVLQWKGKLPAGRVYRQPVIQLDVLPTALAAAGVPAKASWKLDGVNLLPYLEETQLGTPHDSLYWRMGPQRAIRKGDWKLVQYDVNADLKTAESGVASRSGWPTVTSPRLYNVAEDVGETWDLATAHPEKVQELDAAWQAWNKELATPLWGPSQRPSAKSPATAKP
ncbi:MAG: sulfatase [Thermoguttaceae bacterium]